MYKQIPKKKFSIGDCCSVPTNIRQLYTLKVPIELGYVQSSPINLILLFNFLFQLDATFLLSLGFLGLQEYPRYK